MRNYLAKCGLRLDGRLACYGRRIQESTIEKLCGQPICAAHTARFWREERSHRRLSWCDPRAIGVQLWSIGADRRPIHPTGPANLLQAYSLPSKLRK